MANLSALRQRIATVETIKKTTHAMRLIAMSHHARLRADQERIKQYCADVALLDQSPAQQSFVVPPSAERLIIVVASEKGLCGSFNTALFDYCSAEIISEFPDALYCAIGKQAREYLAQHAVRQIDAYEPLTINRWYDHVRDLAAVIMKHYSHLHISILHNTSKSFFVRTIALHTYNRIGNHHEGMYAVEGDVQALAQYRESLRLRCFLFEHVGASLVAEQAARFMSMDLATRNAETLLETMRLDYNKMRQAHITRELTDLAGAL